MSSDWTPLLRPREWIPPSALDMVTRSPVNCLPVTQGIPLNSEMRRRGLTILDPSTSPTGSLAEELGAGTLNLDNRRARRRS